MEAVADLDVPMPAGRRCLLFMLANEADTAGNVSVYVEATSQSFLAARCGWAKTETVRINMKKLIAAGLVQVRRTGAGTSRNEYFLPFVRRWSPRPTEDSAGEGDSVPPTKGGQPILGLKQENKHVLSKEAVSVWFEANLWSPYPAKAKRPKGLAALLDLSPDQALLEEIAAGLTHWLRAAEIKREQGEWFQSWPHLHNFLADERWRERFDYVGQETATSDDRCAECGRPGVTSHGRRMYCRTHNPLSFRCVDQEASP